MLCLGLIGNPVAHSISPEIYHKKFEEHHIQGSYSLFPLSDISDLIPFLNNHPNISGLNVTIPFKEIILPYLNETDAAATAIGAVNTVLIKRSGGNHYLMGYNTDASGFEDTLISHIDFPVSALVLGTGGSSRAVQYILKKLHIPYTLVSRKENPAVTISYELVDRTLMEKHTLIINTTPLGMSPESESLPPLPYHFLTHRHLLYDLVYNPESTSFLMKGQAHGARTMNGLAMLHAQADYAFRLFMEHLE
jgi:shikimate dehydrogenase